MSIEKLLAELSGIKDDLSKKENEIDGYWSDYYFEKYGVKRGSEVKISDGSVGVVVEVDVWPKSLFKPWIKARMLKKDGTPGKFVKQLYRDWELNDVPPEQL